MELLFQIAKFLTKNNFRFSLLFFIISVENNIFDNFICACPIYLQFFYFFLNIHNFLLPLSSNSAHWTPSPAILGNPVRLLPLSSKWSYVFAPWWIMLESFHCRFWCRKLAFTTKCTTQVFASSKESCCKTCAVKSWHPGSSPDCHFFQLLGSCYLCVAVVLFVWSPGEGKSQVWERFFFIFALISRRLLLPRSLLSPHVQLSRRLDGWVVAFFFFCFAGQNRRKWLERGGLPSPHFFYLCWKSAILREVVFFCIFELLAWPRFQLDDWPLWGGGGWASQLPNSSQPTASSLYVATFWGVRGLQGWDLNNGYFCHSTNVFFADQSKELLRCEWPSPLLFLPWLQCYKNWSYFGHGVSTSCGLGWWPTSLRWMRCCCVEGSSFPCSLQFPLYHFFLIQVVSIFKCKIHGDWYDILSRQIELWAVSPPLL